MDLPSSDHTMTTLDAHPVLGNTHARHRRLNCDTFYRLVADEAVNGQLTFMIQVSGTVRYQDKSAKTFQQNFIITAQGDKWKIVTDCFRLQEPIGSK